MCVSFFFGFFVSTDFVADLQAFFYDDVHAIGKPDFNGLFLKLLWGVFLGATIHEGL